MTANGKDTKRKWQDPDDAPEWSEEVFARAELSIAGEVVRPATGTIMRRGRPPIGDAPKQQVTLRLPREVIEHFKADGAGWQSRISSVLEKHVGRARKSA